MTKYSKFVSFPLYMNGRRLNTLQVRPGYLQAQVAVEISRSTSGWQVRGGTGRCVRAPGLGVLGEARSVGAGRSMCTRGSPFTAHTSCSSVYSVMLPSPWSVPEHFTPRKRPHVHQQSLPLPAPGPWHPVHFLDWLILGVS